MSDEFGTVNVGRGARSREIEVLREHYQRHRHTLLGLAAEAPTEHLAGEYQRVVRELDTALMRLDELEGRNNAAAAATPAPPVVPPPPTAPPTRPPHPARRGQETEPGLDPHGDPLRLKTEPGSRPLVHTNDEWRAEAPAGATPGQSSRVLLIVLAGLAVLGLIAWLAWRASSDRRDRTTTIVDEPNATGTVTDTGATMSTTDTSRTIVPAGGGDFVTLRPELVDFGVVRKGTRAVRQVQITNDGDAPAQLTVSRSQCRCLYYEYNGTVAPGKRETLTVTIDGARAKAGTLRETIGITSKTDPASKTSFEVAANVQ